MSQHRDCNGWPCIGKYIGIVVDESVKDDDRLVMQYRQIQNLSYDERVRIQYGYLCEQLKTNSFTR